MKTLLVLLLGLASSLLPSKCATASNVKGPQQIVTETIHNHLYFDNNNDEQMTGVVKLSFLIDEKGKINIIEEMASDEQFKNFVNKKLAELVFNPAEVSGQRFIVSIRTRE